MKDCQMYFILFNMWLIAYSFNGKSIVVAVAYLIMYVAYSFKEHNEGES